MWSLKLKHKDNYQYKILNMKTMNSQDAEDKNA